MPPGMRHVAAAYWRALPTSKTTMNTTCTWLLRWLIVLAALLGAGAACAQISQSPNSGPFRTLRDGADDKLVLLGYDAVAYFTQGEAVKGDPAIKTDHLGVTYRFASEADKAEFMRDPAKYMPQFGGFCA